MVRHWLKARRDEVANDAIHTSEVESERSVPDALLAVEQSKTDRFVTDDVTEPRRWKRSLLINLTGAAATGIVLIVFIVTKFFHGAWLVVVTIPILVSLFLAIHRHYVSVARQLSLEHIGDLLKETKNTVIVPVSGIHAGVIKALQYAKSIAPESVTAVYVDFDESATSKLKEHWQRLGTDVKLIILPSPYRELTRPLLRYIYRVDRQRDDDMVTVVIPEFVPKRWWQHLLHNQSSLLLKAALLFKENVVVTNIPYHLK
jgi:hypothetical protein